MSEDSLFSVDSVTRRIHSDSSMFAGGIRALLQQALHPEAMAGVAQNSNFREDAWGRLQRTGDYVGLLTFGPKNQAEALAARVRGIHSKLGLDDPHLLLWVHMSMVDSFLDCAVRSGLELSQSEQDQYLAEMVIFAELVGIDANEVPASVPQMKNYFQAIQPELAASEDAKRAALFLTFPPMPTAVRLGTLAAPAWAGVAAIATASLPNWARNLYHLPSFPGHVRATDLALRQLRSSIRLIPESWLGNPSSKFAQGVSV
ncbi:MAG: oxygenase MpaB family protein [Actinomycetes bacterium]